MRRLIFVMLAAAACGKSEERPPELRPPSIVVADAAVAFDRATFCDTVFPLASITPKSAAELRNLTEPSRDPKAVATCLYEAGTSEELELRAHLVVDCRATSLDVPRLREMAKTMAGESGEFEELSIGRGGARAYVPRMKTRYVGFVHGELPCAISVSLDHSSGNGAVELARAVATNLSSSNRPR